MQHILTLPNRDIATRWKAVLAYLSEAYALRDTQALSKTQAHIYADACADLPMDAVEEAARQLVRTSQWFPKPAELREAAERIRDQHEEQRWNRSLPAHSGVRCQDCDDTG